MQVKAAHRTTTILVGATEHEAVSLGCDGGIDASLPSADLTLIITRMRNNPSSDLKLQGELLMDSASDLVFQEIQPAHLHYTEKMPSKAQEVQAVKLTHQQPPPAATTSSHHQQPPPAAATSSLCPSDIKAPMKSIELLPMQVAQSSSPSPSQASPAKKPPAEPDTEASAELARHSLLSAPSAKVDDVQAAQEEAQVAAPSSQDPVENEQDVEQEEVEELVDSEGEALSYGRDSSDTASVIIPLSQAASMDSPAPVSAATSNVQSTNLPSDALPVEISAVAEPEVKQAQDVALPAPPPETKTEPLLDEFDMVDEAEIEFLNAVKAVRDASDRARALSERGSSPTSSFLSIEDVLSPSHLLEAMFFQMPRQTVSSFASPRIHVATATLKPLDPFL
jgi:hypothetical protein